MKTTIKKANLDLFVVAPGVWGMKDLIVNLYAINNPTENNWWLVDTGFRWSATKIKLMAELLFGAGSKPAAIILTHGHFDHVGAVKQLSEEWDIPVYAHHLEIPYLTGLSSYPPADPAAGGGLMSDLSFIYPKGPVNIEDKVVSLPQGGRIPGLPDWQYIHTPGHAPGHVSLYRASDKVLIAGDAITTTKAESMIFSVFQLKKLSGPPRYLTSDWVSAESSVEELANLEPETLASGHGRPVRGESLRKSLHNLVRDFKKVAVPQKGRYTNQPALMDDSGVVHIPPKNPGASTAPTLKILGITAGVLLTILLFKKSKKKWKKKKESARELRNQVGSVKGKYALKPVIKEARHAVKESEHTAKNDMKKIKDDLKDKSRDVSGLVKKEVKKISNPALELLDDLKYKARRTFK